jgi:hypothetical protein
MTRKQFVEKQKRNKRIRPEEVAYLREVTGDQIMYSPYQQRREDVKAPGQNGGENRVYEAASIIGCSAVLPEMRDVPVASGRFFTETEERMRQPVGTLPLRVASRPQDQDLGN